MSPGEYSHSDGSNHAMSLGLVSQYRSGHDNLPISDNNVSTTNDALDAGDWDVPENEADLDVSIASTDEDVNILRDWILSQICHWLSITIYTKTKSVQQTMMMIVDTKHRLDSDCHVSCEGNEPTMSHLSTLTCRLRRTETEEKVTLSAHLSVSINTRNLIRRWQSVDKTFS